MDRVRSGGGCRREGTPRVLPAFHHAALRRVFSREECLCRGQVRAWHSHDAAISKDDVIFMRVDLIMTIGSYQSEHTNLLDIV